MGKRSAVLLISFVLLVSTRIFASDAYQLTIHAQNPGLFCVFNTVIGALDFYEKGQCSGLKVDFEDEGLYYDSACGLNWWEYYFEPIKVGTIEGLNFKKFPNYKKTIFTLQGQFDISLERAHQLIQKYIKLKPHVQEKIDEIYEQNFKDSFVIGVHYRGTDKKSEAPRVSFEEAYWKIEDVIRDHPNEKMKIFLATDDGGFYKYLEEKYSGMLIGLDAIRSENGKPVHFSEKKENYRKGEEAIVDSFLLSKCNILVKTASNLSDCSRQFNPSIPTIHLNSPYYNE